MNYLSWLIYLADVSDTLKQAGIGFVVLSVVLLVLAGFVWAGLEGDWWLPRNWQRGLITLFFVGAIIAIFAPQRRTMYLIAASEAGERAANSDTGKAVLNETRDLLLKKLRELNAEK